MEFSQPIKQGLEIGWNSESLHSIQYGFEKALITWTIFFPLHINPGTDTLSGLHGLPLAPEVKPGLNSYFCRQGSAGAPETNQ